MYGEFPELKIGTDYFKSLMTNDEWIERRAVAAKQFYQSLVGELADPSGMGRYFSLKDQIGWYLYLGESFTDHPPNYEVFYGCRVVPVLAAIGRNIHFVDQIAGFEDRARRIVHQDRAQPNGPLFELLVALAYARDGAEVAFRPEMPGREKAHDLDVTIDDEIWAVECKRLETGEYAENERQKMRDLWMPCSKTIADTGRSTYIGVDFRIEMQDVPDDYLVRISDRFLKSGQTSLLWHDDIAGGVIGDLDLQPLQSSLKTGYVLHPGPVYNKLLTGSYYRYDNLNIIHKVKFAPNPHFVDEIDQAIVARWKSVSEEAIDRKARDIRRKLADANSQLPDGVPGVIHIGLEALGADEIEHRRYEKIMQTIDNFDPKGKDLRYIYWHHFAAEVSPEEVWAIDETFSWRGLYPTKRPLNEGRLLLPNGAIGRAGTHWDGKGNESYRD